MNAPLRHGALGAVGAVAAIGAGAEADGIDGGIVLRTARPEDLAAIEDLVRGLGPASRMQRFFTPRRELPPFLARALVERDPRHHLVVAERGGALLALGQYALLPMRPACDMALLVADAWQDWGLGTRLLQRLLDDAHAAGLREMEAEVLPGNGAMLHLARRFGFEVGSHPDDPHVLRILREVGPQASPGWAAAEAWGRRAAAWEAALV